MAFSLNTKIIKPENDSEIKNAVVLLHGYGGDGNDISLITLNWKRFLPNTIFLCPNGHEKCEINPRDYILKEALKAEDIIKNYIDEVKSKYNLNNSKICISGFSQGCMMSINIGLTSDEHFNCVVGFSGKIINKENLLERIKSKTKMLLMHGDLDTIVPSNHLLEAEDYLLRQKVDVQIKMIKNCEHHIPIEASSLALNYIKKNFNF